MVYIIASLAFGGVFLLIVGANLLAGDVTTAQRLAARKRLEEELRLRQKDRAKQAMANRQLYELAAEGFEIQSKPTLRERFVKLVDESGLKVQPQQLAGICGACFFAAAGLVWFASQSATLGVLVGVGIAILPVMCVQVARMRRQEKLLSQLPDAFDLMARSLKAGQTISQAIQAVAEEFSPPVAWEFGYCYDQQNLGLTPEAAMRELARRTGLLELKVFVLAVMIHRQTGGNLSVLLEKLATVIRDRYRIRGAIKALTAEGRFQAIILLMLPPGLMMAIMVINPEYMQTLFEFPLLIAATGVMMAIGAYWMNKIISFDV